MSVVAITLLEYSRELNKDQSCTFVKEVTRAGIFYEEEDSLLKQAAIILSVEYVRKPTQLSYYSGFGSGDPDLNPDNSFF